MLSFFSQCQASPLLITMKDSWDKIVKIHIEGADSESQNRLQLIYCENFHKNKYF